MKSIQYLSRFVPYIPDEGPLDLKIMDFVRKYGDDATLGAMRRARKGLPGIIEFTEEESRAFVSKILYYLNSMPSTSWIAQLDETFNK